MAGQPQGAAAPAQAGGGGSMAMLREKRGPLPVWAWLALGLGLLLAVVVWRRNRSSAAETTSSYVDELPGDQTAGPVFIVPGAPTPPVIVNNNIPDTVPTAPPGGGAPPPGIPIPPKNPGPKTPTPPKKPAPKTPTYSQVTVKRYTNSNPPWQSTLSGIAAHFGIKDWHTIWNDPRNAKLKKDRGSDPKRIRPGDVLYVRRG